VGAELSAPGEPAFDFVRRLSKLEAEPRRASHARPRPDQIDLSSYRIETEGPVPVPLLETVRRHLRSLGAAENGAARFALRVDPKLSPSSFVIENATLAAGSAAALFQAVRRMQDETELAGGPYLPASRAERSIAFDPRYLYS
jgi:hypothetical protein